MGKEDKRDEADAIERVRELVVHRAQRESLRIMAEESGVSRSGLQKFQGGSKPRPSTRDKLLRWYSSLTPEQRVVQPAPTPAEERSQTWSLSANSCASAKTRSGCTSWPTKSG
jgi:hypothetical protein